MFWDEKIELMEQSELRRLQLQLLRKTVSQAMAAPYYAKVLAEIGVGPENIKSLDDIRRLPFTEKHHLRDGFPYQFMATPQEDVVRVHVSSGTTGVPTAVYHTQSDLDHWTNLVARCLFMAGMRKTDVFQNMVGYGLFTGGLGLHYGAEKIGSLVLPSGVGNSSRQISLLRQFKTTWAHIIPSYALKLLDSFRDKGLDPDKDTSLTNLVIGAEPHSAEARQRIEEAYGVMAFNSYGLSECNGPGVALECREQDGMHLWEDNYILEVINPDTMEPVPDGEVGELVLTTLRREAMPLIRYRTRDLASVIPGVCACGRTHRRISRISGRTDDMLIIKGVNIYPMQVEAVLMGFAELGNTYLIVLTKEGPLDQMTLKVEMAEKQRTMQVSQMERLAKKLSSALRDELLITPRVELVPPESLPAAEGKAVRVLDKRG